MREARSFTDAELERGVAFAWGWARKLRAYSRLPPWHRPFSRSGPNPGHPNFQHFVLAALLADRLGVPDEEYLEAHFWNAHRLYGRAPEVRFLHNERGFTAAQQVEAWRAAQAASRTGAVLAEGTVSPLSQTRRAARQEHYLRELCVKCRVAAEDIIRAYGGQGACVFDEAWLRAREDWRRFEAAGWYAEHAGPDVDYLRRRREERHAA